MTRGHRGIIRHAALLALAVPFFAACSVTDQTMGVRDTTNAISPIFNSYVAIGTSIGAGFQSGGINDSTQQQSYAVLLAKAMGYTPESDWFYPSLSKPGCPAPLINPLTGARVGGANNPKGCAYRSPASASALMNNVSIPGMRLAQVLNLDTIPFGITDTLGLAQFITGGRNPMDVARAQHATFVTLEAFANDVLGAATHQDTTLLTPMASFNAYLTATANVLDSMGAKVAVVGVPNVTSIPFFSAGVMFYCLHTGAVFCTGIPAGGVAPFNSANFNVANSCLPGALGGVGDSMLVGFNSATPTIAGVLAAGGAAHLSCDSAFATVTTAAGTSFVGPVLSTRAVVAIGARVAQMNAAIYTLANARGYAVISLDSVLAAKVAAKQIPPFPDFTNPTNMFGPWITQDGVHPSAAAHKELADSIAARVNRKYSVTLPLP